MCVGPAFAQGRTAEPVEAVDRYRLMCRLLHLKPAPNDGDDDAVHAPVSAQAQP